MRLRHCAVVAALALSLTSGCQASNEIIAVGTVADTYTKISLPMITSPVVTADADQYSATGKAQQADQSLASTQTSQTSTSEVSYSQIKSVAVTAGDLIQVGDPIASLDNQALESALKSRQAEAALAAAQPGLIQDQIDELKDKRSDIASGRQKINSAQSQLSEAQQQIDAQTKTAKATQTKLLARWDQLDRELRVLPPGLERQKAQAEMAAVDNELAKLKPLAKKLKAEQKKISTSEREAQTGLAKLKTTRKELDDAISTLKGAKSLAKISAQAAQIAVDEAALSLEKTQVISPVNGQIVSVAQIGQVLAPGATAAIIRENKPSVVKAWVSPDERSKICDGATVSLTTDWPGEQLAGSVSSVGNLAVYPPTSMATEEVNLTRAFQVIVHTDKQLPPGAPITANISPC